MRRRLALLVVSAIVPLGLPAVGAAAPPVGRLGPITGFEARGDTYTVAAGDARVRVIFHDDDLFRIWVAPDGRFTDPANDDPADPAAPDADIVVKRDYRGAGSHWSDRGDHYLIHTDRAALRMYKRPFTFALYSADNRTLVWREITPLAITAAGATQALARGTTEQFFGGGMQNGRFSHRGETVQIARNYNWNDGGYPNAAPFYASTAGYGVLRNTFSPGTYTFLDPLSTAHQEQRFDAYYFVGGLKQVIDGYTELTGRPLMLPMYALEMGSADCYLHNANRGERRTYRDSVAVADGYVQHGMPLGWMLVNDGYGCGYEDLPETGAALRDRNIELGLWTEAALDNQEYEVRQGGVRVRKTDIAWVGPGYRFALDACETAHAGIAQYSVDRPAVVTIEGWAGSQRCGTLWSGDQTGSWDYIRWQIPTYAGSTMSGQAVTTGDVDGIFGGSAETYVRDLQWKAFLPYTYAMSGWAAKDKHPWVHGEPYTSINRGYLTLHERLLPYLYTHLAEAHDTGVGPVRPLALEYPHDAATWGEKAKYEFLSGQSFLVAPVYRDTDERDGIYLPSGTWIDYWTGRTYQGPVTVDDYDAPLDTLPLFVRGGAIVPMFPEGTLDWQQGKQSGQLDIDVYPQGNSNFTLYEDDGRTRAHERGESARQRFDVSAPQQGSGPITIRIGKLTGSYQGKPAARQYLLHVHTGSEPATVNAGPNSSWSYDNGTVHIRTPAVASGQALDVHILGASAVGGRYPSDRQTSLQTTTPSMLAPGGTGEVVTTFGNDTGLPLMNASVRLTAPDGWRVEPVGSTSFPMVAPGARVRATFRVTAPPATVPKRYELAAQASYRARGGSYTVVDRASVRVPYASLAAAFNNVGITPETAPAAGNLDGAGSSFIAERLAGQGATPGATVTHDGVAFRWPDVRPGTPDNVQALGQTIAIRGQGTHLAFLGTETGFAEGLVTVHYADGTTEQRSLGFPNWCCADPTGYGAEPAITTLGKNTPQGPAYPTVEYRVFYNDIRIDPGKDVFAVTLPQSDAIHLFALAFATRPLPPPPTSDTWVSDLDWIDATNGWGPVEKDRSNGEDAGGDGNPITLAGTVYQKGLGAHAPSTVGYHLGGHCRTFTATIGVDDEIADYGSVVFSVVADGQTRYTSPTLTGTSTPIDINVDVSGARVLELVVTNAGDGNTGDHADWAAARLTCSP